MQILYPQNKENIVIWSTIGGALFNLILNIILIPIYSEVGTAIATFIAELAVLIIQLILGYKYLPFKLGDIRFKHYMIATIIMTLIVISIIYTFDDMWSQTILSIIVGGSVYVGYLIYKEDDIITSILAFILRK
jgi:O-antigen/teichoic acid export membrane protein